MNSIDIFSESVPASLLGESGGVFYSGKEAFATAGQVYLLGINPGGRPEKGHLPTVGEQVAWARNKTQEWSSYVDETWQGQSKPGTAPVQKRVRWLLSALDLQPHLVPASNLVFKRSARENELMDFNSYAELCWPFHQRIVEHLSPKAIICFGNVVGNFVRRKLGATEATDQFTESNLRRWRSHAYGSMSLKVIVLKHPSVAAWDVPASDPSAMVVRALGGVFNDDPAAPL